MWNGFALNIKSAGGEYQYKYISLKLKVYNRQQTDRDTK